MRCRNCEEPIDVLDLCEICEMKERVIEPVEVMMCKRGHFMTKGAGKRAAGSATCAGADSKPPTGRA
jgi:hypothetical protein